MPVVRVHAPRTLTVELVEFVDDVAVARSPLRRDGDDWTGDVADGVTYGLVADGAGPGFDPSKVLLDPRALEVHLRPGSTAPSPAAGASPTRDAARWPSSGRHRRLGVRHGGARACRAWSSCTSTATPAARAGLCRGPSGRSWPSSPGSAARGHRRRADAGAPVGPAGGQLLGLHAARPRRRRGPLRGRARRCRRAGRADRGGPRARPRGLARRRFNHTTEVDAGGPTYSLRGLGDQEAYRHDQQGAYVQSSGCGNDLDVRSPFVADLVVWALDRLADLGVDGFRFDLAAVLTHDDRFVARLDAWAAQRGVRMIAEPWDAAGRYQLGRTGRVPDGCSGTTATARTAAGSSAARRGSSPPSSSGCREAPTCSTRPTTA